MECYAMHLVGQSFCFLCSTLLLPPWITALLASRRYEGLQTSSGPGGPDGLHSRAVSLIPAGLVAPNKRDELDLRVTKSVLILILNVCELLLLSANPKEPIIPTGTNLIKFRKAKLIGCVKKYTFNRKNIETYIIESG